MYRTDWLLQQIHQLARALANALGAEQRDEAIDAELEALAGMKLRVLGSLPPSMVVRLIGQRFGDTAPERLFAARELVRLAVDEGHDLQLHVDALHAALVDAVGEDGVVELEAALTRARAGSTSPPPP
ncbi:MAG: hypothetical protein H6737_29895 [Alphaproteobacteria bacterium]|nr:hypothetical protein [Alphaproteobacteria bacterium]